MSLWQESLNSLIDNSFEKNRKCLTRLLRFIPMPNEKVLSKHYKAIINTVIIEFILTSMQFLAIKLLCIKNTV